MFLAEALKLSNSSADELFVETLFNTLDDQLSKNSSNIHEVILDKLQQLMVKQIISIRSNLRDDTTISYNIFLNAPVYSQLFNVAPYSSSSKHYIYDNTRIWIGISLCTRIFSNPKALVTCK